MMMTAIKKRDGTYHCRLMIQDGYENWDEPTREQAVSRLIEMNKFMNGNTTTEADVHFVEET